MKTFWTKIKRRTAAALIGAAMVLLMIPTQAAGDGYPGPEIVGETYCVIDGNTGEVIISKNKDQKMYPASTTKILTALLVLENVEDLTAPITFTATGVDVPVTSSTLNPKAMIGERMTVMDVLCGMLLKSANECAKMLGEYVAGSEAAFAEMMNARAAKIGCRNSHFANAHGFHDPEHYTTAYDLCLILQEAMKNPRYREINGTKFYAISATDYSGERVFPVGHAMLNGAVPEEGVIGGKTGSTPEAGKVLATACERNGLYTVSTLFRSDADHMYTDEKVLLEYAYGMAAHEIAPVEWVEVHDIATATEGVRLRRYPSLTGDPILTVPAGEKVKRTAVYGDWSQVVYGEQKGYVASSFLQSDEPEKVPVTTAYEWPTEPTEPPTTTEPATEKQTEEETSSQIATSISESERHSEEGTTVPGEETSEDQGALLAWLPVFVLVILVLIWLLLFVCYQTKKRGKRRRRS